MLEYRRENILFTDCKYIVHQCNLVSRGAGGLAKDLFYKFPYADVYKQRDSNYQPDRRLLGEVDIKGNGVDQRYVINLYGQFYPGRPRHNQGFDSYDMRETYFDKALNGVNGIGGINKIKDLDSIAFPYKIGCGLAGGAWSFYEKILEKFSDIVNANVVICRI